MKHIHLGPLATLAIAWCAFAAYVLLTAPQLPERVATHFATGGGANGWMTREGHVRFTLAMGTALPAFILAIFALIRRTAGWGLNIPHKDYWLAPERREQTFAFVQQQGIWLAAILIGFFAAMHHAILAANTHTPPSLSLADAGWLGGAYIVAMIAWIAVFVGRFFFKSS